MKFISFDVLVAILICSPATTNAFVHTSRRLVRNNPTRPVFSGSALRISSIGLGPDEQKKSDEGGEGSEEESGSEPEPERELVAGVDYEIPDHEAYRTSRRSTIDEKCDVWFESMLGGESNIGILGSVAEDARKTLLTPVPLVNEVRHVLSKEIMKRNTVSLPFRTISLIHEISCFFFLTSHNIYNYRKHFLSTIQSTLPMLRRNFHGRL